MVVIVLSACKPALRGHLTQWMLEVAPGIFIGNVSARVRERLWLKVRSFLGSGKALIAYRVINEQGFTVDTINHEWEPTDLGGLTVMRRPAKLNENP